MRLTRENVRMFLLHRYGPGYMDAAGVPRALEQCASDMFLAREEGDGPEFIRRALTMMRAQGFITQEGA